MRTILTILAASTITLGACTNSDNPQLSMCQAVAKQLSNNTVSSWDSNSEQDNVRNRVVKVSFTSSQGQSNVLSCNYPKHEDGTIDTAPDRVALNNQAVDGKVLLSAGTKASKELLAGTYKNTVAASAELANQAADKAGDLADKAKDAAIDGAKALQDLQKQ